MKAGILLPVRNKSEKNGFHHSYDTQITNVIYGFVGLPFIKILFLNSLTLNILEGQESRQEKRRQIIVISILISFQLEKERKRLAAVPQFLVKWQL